MTGKTFKFSARKGIKLAKVYWYTDSVLAATVSSRCFVYYGC